MSAYAELHCLSDFSFQRGASNARELFERAKACGYEGLAITDECSLAGIVRAWEASRDTQVPLIVGAEFQLHDGPKLVLLVETQDGYEALCRLITDARRASSKGSYRIGRQAFETPLPGLFALWVPSREPLAEEGHWLSRCFPRRAWLAVELHRGPNDDLRLAQLQQLAKRWACLSWHPGTRTCTCAGAALCRTS